jgi:hypothetical protein
MMSSYRNGVKRDEKWQWRLVNPQMGEAGFDKIKKLYNQ